MDEEPNTTPLLEASKNILDSYKLLWECIEEKEKREERELEDDEAE